MTAAPAVLDGPVPGYLGRVLDGDGDPVGTCFQVVPGVLVTAWHVLDGIGAAAGGAPVRVDPLAGGQAFEAAVARLDRARDLAVLVSAVPLPATAGELAATDQMAPRTAVTVTGHCVIARADRTARSLTTIGRWAGPAMWEDATPTGRMTAEALLPGMSGAPVIRDDDGAVAGVVSGRYNSADDWLKGTVWVARTEDLAVLLAGVAEVSVGQPPLAGPAATGPGARPGRRWDVALSFASAQRDYVERVAAALRARGVRCFYDADEQTELWGRHLAEELPAIYGEQAAAVVVFISAEYAARDWTRLERRAALARAVRERREYVLPARFDDTQLPGLVPDIVTVDLRTKTPEQFAAMIVGKLAGLDITAPAPPVPAAGALSGPVDLVLAVTGDQVRLAGGGDASAVHGGVRPGLAEAVNEARRARSRLGLATRGQDGAPAAGELMLSRAGRLLADSFLPGPVAVELEKVLAAAQRAHQPVRLGLAVPAELAGLPWEALPSPDGRGPLGLHPLVSMYRKTDAATGRVLPGPLRIVVAIAAPESGGGAVLDYENELRNVLAAVHAARQDAADVRVVPFATPAAIREELGRGPAHVLHVSGHGSPGTLSLEDDDGSARPVTADEFVDLAVPPGQMPPVVVLSACYTDAAGSQGGASFAARLCQRGAAAVIATETSITDRYATRLLARVYGALAQAGDPDVVGALADARRQVQAGLETSPDRRDGELAALGEWAAVTVLAAAGSVPVLDPGRTAPPARQPSRPGIAGLAARQDWYFVGRRREQRTWPADLTGSALPGIVIYGIGGTGKTTLAAELITAVLGREPGRVLVSLTGPLTLESLLGAVITAIRRGLLLSGQDTAMELRALDVAARADLGWQDRLAILRGRVLDHVPVLLLLDNFEDNLRPGEDDGDAGYAVGDEVLAGLLAAWVADPGRSRLLVTCRYRFALPGGAERALSFRQLGPLSRAETMKLAWSLPALDTLDESQLEQVWRLAGGHPRSLEYLDALLSGGQARYPDVTERLDAAITHRLGEDERDHWLQARSKLDVALAATVVLVADDVLLDALLARLARVSGAAELLLGVSVYREVVDHNAVLFQAGQRDPDAEDIPDREAASQQITSILAAAGITVDDSFHLSSVPGDIRAQLAPHIAALNRLPMPPFRERSGLKEQIEACQAAGLLTITQAGYGQLFFVHRWTATELADRAAQQDPQQLVGAHQQAAGYWLWRVRVWPQDPATDVHDQLEGRYHLLQAGDVKYADQITYGICLQLHTWGAWDQEASLIHDSLARQAADFPQRATWIYQLGRLLQDRADYDEAARQYQRALDTFERLGDRAGMANSYHQLGIVAFLRANYGEAARQFQRALDIREQLGDQSGMADSYGELGMLAQQRGDYDEAARQFQRALDTFERLGDQTKMAIASHNLGTLAGEHGDYDEAARQFQRALDIFERLGDQVKIGQSYRNLGILAQRRGDYDEAARQYQRALDISERLGDQNGMANTYSQLGVLEAERGGSIAAAVTWDVRALEIRLRLDIPQSVYNLRRLVDYRRELGTKPFTRVLTDAVGDTDLAETITSLLDQLDADNNYAG